MVKASFSVRLAMVTRGFETRLQILSSKEVHMVRRDGFNHVRDSIWRRHQPIFSLEGSQIQKLTWGVLVGVITGVGACVSVSAIRPHAFLNLSFLLF